MVTLFGVTLLASVCPGFLNLGIKAAATWPGSFAATNFRYTFFYSRRKEFIAKKCSKLSETLWKTYMLLKYAQIFIHTLFSRREYFGGNSCNFTVQKKEQYFFLCAGTETLCNINTDVQTNSLNHSHSKWQKKKVIERVLLKFMELQQGLILITSLRSALIN